MEYWTIIDDHHAGPFTAAELLERGLCADTPVWTPGLTDWVKAADIEELRMLLDIPAEPTIEAEHTIEVEQTIEADQTIEIVEAPAPRQDYQPQGEFTPQQNFAPYPPCPPTYLAWAIVVTIICCIPLGIAAIICSTMTKQAYNRGDILRAEKMSNATQWLIILAIVLGLITLPLQIVISAL